MTDGNTVTSEPSSWLTWLCHIGVEERCRPPTASPDIFSLGCTLYALMTGAPPDALGEAGTCGVGRSGAAA
jgi:hypothetical protein